MELDNILQLLTGVALFLFGMSLMGDGLKELAGKELEKILFKLTGSNLKGTLFGVGVTAVIQSSSATSIMVVSLVNSGVMTSIQAIPIVLGSIFGTSITGWILCLSSISASGILSLFSSTGITCIAAVAGIYFKMFNRNKTLKKAGNVLIGFAVLMFGMSVMSDSVSCIKESPAFMSMMVALDNPLLSFVVGVLATAVLQSSSAVVGIIQALSISGVMNFSVVFPMLLGIGIGAAVPVLLSSIGSKTEGKVTAFSYLVIAVAGAFLSAVVFYPVQSIVHFDFFNVPAGSLAIAFTNSIYRLFSVIVLLPFVSVIGRAMSKFHKETELEKETQLKPLDDGLLAFPELAIRQCRDAVIHMASLSKTNVIKAFDSVLSFSPAVVSEIETIEDSVDRYEDKLGTYLLKLTALNLDGEQNDTVGKFLHTITDFERISDHAVNLSENSQELNEKKLSLSPDAMREVIILISAVKEVVDLSVRAFIDDDIQTALRVEPLESVVDGLINQIKQRHIERMKAGKCQFTTSFAFNDILANCERISDHCSNIAVAIISIDSDSFDTHEYLGSLKKLHNGLFDSYYNEFAARYRIN